MRRAWFVLLAACRSFYGLDDTQIQSDARTFACPALGENPRFDRDLRQIVLRDCQGYNIRGNRAVAVCLDIVGGTRVRQVDVGPPDGELAPAVGIPSGNLPSFIRAARLGLGGDRIYVTHDAMITTYRRRPDETWQFEADLMGYYNMSTVADDGGRDRFLAITPAGGLFELVADDPWTPPPVMPHALGDLGVPVYGAGLTLDGLRLVLDSTDGMFYSDRMQPGGRFRTAAKLDMPEEFDPHIADDCSRIFLNDVGSVFYVEQSP